MHFVGLNPTLLLELGGAVGLVIVGLYILKLRRRPIAVPYSRIWERVLRDKEATSLFSQLKRLLSLLLQLVLLTLILLALGDPRPTASVVDARNIVVLVDASASMQATDVPLGRLAVAKEELRKLVRGLSGADRMLIAQMDAGATPLSTLTSDAIELEGAVEAVSAVDCAADFARGLRFALDTLRGLPRPEILVLSDGALGEPVDSAGSVDLGSTKLTFIPVGVGSRNAAITEFSVRRYPLDKSRYEVMLEVTNTTEAPLDLELQLLGDGQVTELSKLRLSPHERLPRFYPNLSGASHTLEARISLADGTRDDLSADDRAFALLPERRRARVQVVTPGNMYLEAALLLDEYLEVHTVHPAKYPLEGAFDVTIFDGVSPKVASGSGSVLYLNPGGPDLPFQILQVVENSDPNYKLGFDELDGKHPILRYTSFADINIAKARILKPEREDRIVGRSIKGPLLISGQRSGWKFVALGFDPRESDFPMRISWPLFLINVVDEFVREDTRYISSYRTGEVWSVPFESGSATAVLEQPDGAQRVVPVKEGRAVVLGLRTGFYKLTSETGNAFEFAANLGDPAESHITPNRELRVGGALAGVPTEFKMGVRREFWTYFLMALLVLSAVEWFTYHRRVTV